VVTLVDRIDGDDGHVHPPVSVQEEADWNWPVPAFLADPEHQGRDGGQVAKGCLAGAADGEA
jgi:hypothetical protein